jgi:hypothetical protein
MSEKVTGTQRMLHNEKLNEGMNILNSSDILELSNKEH